MLIFGNISINPKGLVNTSKEEFMGLFKGKTNQDLNKVWAAIQEANKAEVKEEVSVQIDEPIEEIDTEIDFMYIPEKKKSKKK